MIARRFSDIARNNRFPLIVFLGFYLLFSLGTFRDYGIAVDENIWYWQSSRYIKHYLHLASPSDESGGIFSIEQASHNYIYPALLRILCHGKAELYHLGNLLLAIPVYLGLYEALLLAFETPWLAFLGPCFLLLFFRFTGDVPINPKDGPFAVYYFFGLAWIYLSRYKIKDIRWEAIVLGVLIGLATTIRAVGITLFPILIGYRLFEYYVDEKAEGRPFSLKTWVSKEWLNFTLVFIVSQCWMMAFWPYLGSNYFGNLLNVFMQSKAYAMDYPMIFMGHIISSIQLPWYYLIVWFGICTPLFILFFFLTSFYSCGREFFAPKNKFYVLLASTFLFHWILYQVLKPVIYNSMRHYLFIVPIMAAMSTMGFVAFLRSGASKGLKRVMIGLVGLNVILVVVQFFCLYPYQYAYFNELVGGLKGAGGRYETEYWTTSFKEATQWLEKHELTDPEKTYYIKTGGTAWQETYYFKPNMQTDPGPKGYDYQIVELQSIMATPGPNQQEIYAVTREDVPFVRVWKFVSEKKK